jgi:hypothetical protein
MKRVDGKCDDIIWWITCCSHSVRDVLVAFEFIPIFPGDTPKRSINDIVHSVKPFVMVMSYRDGVNVLGNGPRCLKLEKDPFHNLTVPNLRKVKLVCQLRAPSNSIGGKKFLDWNQAI